MKDSRKKEIERMAKGIDPIPGSPGRPMTEKEARDAGFAPGEIPSDIQRKKLLDATEIMATKKIEIPWCRLKPVNGRIFVISIAGSDLKTAGGLILPPTFKMQKNDNVEGVNRYFTVAWADDIPEDIKSTLMVGKEVNPFLPKTAEEWELPRVVDWDGNNIFDVIHYTELAGVSTNDPEVVEK